MPLTDAQVERRIVNFLLIKPHVEDLSRAHPPLGLGAGRAGRNAIGGSSRLEPCSGRRDRAACSLLRPLFPAVPVSVGSLSPARPLREAQNPRVRSRLAGVVGADAFTWAFGTKVAEGPKPTEPLSGGFCP